MARSRHSAAMPFFIAGVAMGIIAGFKQVFYLFLILCGIGVAFYMFDSMSETTLDESQYSVRAFNIEQNTIVPGNISPRFTLTVELKNKTDWKIQHIKQNAQLFRCESVLTPFEDCTFIADDNRGIPVNVPAGVTSDWSDTITFMQGTTLPGVLKAKIWYTDVTADKDAN
jgi:hypothetical protein